MYPALDIILEVLAKHPEGLSKHEITRLTGSRAVTISKWLKVKRNLFLTQYSKKTGTIWKLK